MSNYPPGCRVNFNICYVQFELFVSVVSSVPTSLCAINTTEGEKDIIIYYRNIY